MYNPTLKQEYIAQTLTDHYAIMRAQKVFKSIASVETALEKDVAEMSPEEIDLVKKCFNTKSYLGMDAKCRDLRKYLMWSLENKKTSRKTLALTFWSRNYDVSDFCHVSMFGSPEDLAEFLSVSFSPPEDENPEILHMVSIWFMYAGIYPSEVYFVKKNQVDSFRMQITTKDRIFSIPTEAQKTLQIYENLKCYYYTLKDGSGRVVQKRASEYYLVSLKDVAQQSSGKNMGAILLKKSKYYAEVMQKKKRVVSTDVYLSGWFWRTYQNELKTGVVDLDATRGIEPENSHLATQYLKDYATWKDAFYPSET